MQRTDIVDLWVQTPGMCQMVPTLEIYLPEHKTSDCAVVILPGGAYSGHARHEGEGYARFLNTHGISAFVCNYRAYPHRFPLELLDARRAIRYVRYYADRFGIDKNKVAIMGSSAGGHLAALTSTYHEKIDFEGIDEIDKEDYLPNAQILCYPVIKLSVDKTVSSVISCINLLSVEQLEKAHDLMPEYLVSEKTPPCFMWHTLEDSAVPVENSLDYLAALKKYNVPCELHVFPHGKHGLGLAPEDNNCSKHVSQWADMMIKWLAYIGFIE